MQRHKFIPEAFTTDFQVHWGNHPLRPEFLESTYYLYEATRDSYYLHVGKKVLESLQKYAWVPCGYAAVSLGISSSPNYLFHFSFLFLYYFFGRIELNVFIESYSSFARIASSSFQNTAAASFWDICIYTSYGNTLTCSWYCLIFREFNCKTIRTRAWVVIPDTTTEPRNPEQKFKWRD